ncbi:hypothetical protein N9K77_01660 [bacterium]|nr:hypothetical protein [bacterium]
MSIIIEFIGFINGLTFLASSNVGLSFLGDMRIKFKKSWTFYEYSY